VTDPLTDTFDCTNTDVFKQLGTPHLPPGPLMVAEAAASAAMLEQDRALCDCCQLRPGVRTVFTSAAYETWTCEECLREAA
jgi:hypothetical protein